MPRSAEWHNFLDLHFHQRQLFFFRMQGLYIFPAVEEWWSCMRNELIIEFAGKDIVVAGDGQCDSPGFSAKKSLLFLDGGHNKLHS